MTKPDYTWDGDVFKGYVIWENGKPVEPGEVIKRLDALEDIIEQLSVLPTKTLIAMKKKVE